MCYNGLNHYDSVCEKGHSAKVGAPGSEDVVLDGKLGKWRAFCRIKGIRACLGE